MRATHTHADEMGFMGVATWEGGRLWGRVGAKKARCSGSDWRGGREEEKEAQPQPQRHFQRQIPGATRTHLSWPGIPPPRTGRTRGAPGAFDGRSPAARASGCPPCPAAVVATAGVGFQAGVCGWAPRRPASGVRARAWVGRARVAQHVGLPSNMSKSAGPPSTTPALTCACWASSPAASNPVVRRVSCA